MVYVSSSVKATYLSYDSLLNLGLLPRTCPSLDNSTSNNCGSDTSDKQPHVPRISPDINAMRALNMLPGTHHCAQHYVLVSTAQSNTATPSELPFPCTPENNAKMKTWLLDRYVSSTFNTCPHRVVPCMEGPPIVIHIYCDKPAKIALHWQQWVYNDLLRNEALGDV